MDREFAYKPEKSMNIEQFGRTNVTSTNIEVGSIREKPYMAPFTEISNSTPIRSLENMSETHGTYRSRNNVAYDNSDNSFGLNITANNLNTAFSPLNRSDRPKIDHDEYWRTNI